MPALKVSIITLGCDKNTVDSERYLAELIAHGAESTTDLDEAEVIIVNTCGFIDAAKRESIDAIVEAGRYKSDGVCQAVVAVGCLVQRHKDELADALPEVDLFLGAAEADRLIPELTERGLLGDPLVDHPGVRVYSGDLPHVRYLKISEGCDHGCAFCAIPLMRGKHRSFALADVIREAQLLELQGAREVNLVAQDLAHYGRDRRDGVGLPQLLRGLLDETSIPWVRLLYLYSAGLTPTLLDLMARNENLLQFDVLSLALAVVLPLAIARARAVRAARTLSIVIAAIAFVGFAMQILPWFNQVNGEVIALTLPAHLALAWCVLALTLAPETAPARREGAVQPVASRSAA